MSPASSCLPIKCNYSVCLAWLVSADTIVCVCVWPRAQSNKEPFASLQAPTISAFSSAHFVFEVENFHSISIALNMHTNFRFLLAIRVIFFLVFDAFCFFAVRAIHEVNRIRLFDTPSSTLCIHSGVNSNFMFR